MTDSQAPRWCPVCRTATCDCVYCHSARFVRFNGQLIRCDVCNPAPEPAAPALPAPTRVRARRGSTYTDRLTDL